MMYEELLRLRGEVEEPVAQFEYRRPEKQDAFNKFFKEVLSKDTLVLPQDDDADGFLCVMQINETVRILRPNLRVEIYIPDEKAHGVDKAFVDYVRGLPGDKAIFVTDSSSGNIEEMRALSGLALLGHIDHHISEAESELENICDYHANCRYDTDDTLGHMSAGFYTMLHLVNYIRECTGLGERVENELFSLGIMSLVADVCDMQLPYHKSALKFYKHLPNQHILLESFTNRFTENSLYFLGFTATPKINMLFRLRYIDELRALHGGNTQGIVEAVIEIYKNYKAVIDPSLGYIRAINYGKVIYADITGVDEICPTFRGRVVNFTGWYANKLSEHYCLPCIVTHGEGSLKGSVRDCTGANIYNLMQEADFLEGGGHPSAYGFRMEEDKLPNLIYHFDKYYFGNVEGMEKTIEITTLGELSNAAKGGTLMRVGEYNEYTLNNRMGFSYKVKLTDNIERKEKYCKVKATGLDIICFDNTLEAGDRVELIPGFNLGKVQLIAKIMQRG